MAVRVSIYEELLADAIDLHCHIDLEFSTSAFRKRAPEWEWLPQAEALGMRGVVLKSHWWPTAASVPYIRELRQLRVLVPAAIPQTRDVGVGAAVRTV